MKKIKRWLKSMFAPRTDFDPHDVFKTKYGTFLVACRSVEIDRNIDSLSMTVSLIQTRKPYANKTRK